jgi:ubiquinone/menaquinone biosynthesis C-methylase UbiE
MKQNLKWTGERLVTDPLLGKGITEHLHRYAIAIDLVKDKIVLDLACGEGYGTNLLSKTARKVTGIDISKEAILHARKKYLRENIEFIEASAINLPLQDNSIDVVVSFETIEHLFEQESFLNEIKRVLKIEGILIISSPERENYRKLDPENPFHVKELCKAELISLLEKRFRFICYYDQTFHIASIITPQDSCSIFYLYQGDFDAIHKNELAHDRIYTIAVCTDNPTESFMNAGSVFRGEKIYNEYLHASMEKSFREELHKILNSTSYRLGNFLIRPIVLLNNLRWRK